MTDNLNVRARQAVEPIGRQGVDLVGSHEEQGDRLPLNQELRAGQFICDPAGLVKPRPHAFIRSNSGTEDRDDLAGSDGAGKKASGMHDSTRADDGYGNVNFRDEGIAHAVEGQVGTGRDREGILPRDGLARYVDGTIAVEGDAPAEVISAAANVAGVDKRSACRIHPRNESVAHPIEREIRSATDGKSVFRRSL